MVFFGGGEGWDRENGEQNEKEGEGLGLGLGLGHGVLLELKGFGNEHSLCLAATSILWSKLGKTLSCFRHLWERNNMNRKYNITSLKLAGYLEYKYPFDWRYEKVKK